MKKNILKMELRKSFSSRLFLISLLVLSVVSCLSASYVIDVFHENAAIYVSIQPDGNFHKNYILQTLSAYGGWIGCEARSLMQSLFFLLLPIAAVLPYGTSYLEERNSGYLRNLAIRVKMPFYIFSKAVACFSSAFFVVVFPLILNFLIVTTVLPSSIPHINYDIYYLVYFGDLFADLFYSTPIFFVFLYILLNGLFAGLIALLALAISFIIKNRYLVWFLPFLLFLGVEYLASFVFRNVDGNTWSTEFSLINMLHASSTRGEKYWLVFVLEALILLSVSVTIIYIRGKKNEVF